MDCFKKNRTTVLLAGIWASIVLVLWALSEVLLPFLVAVLLAYVLDPLVSRIRLPRWSAVFIIYSVLGIGIYLFSTLFIPELYQEFLRLAKTTNETLHSLRETDLHQLAAQIDYYLRYYQIPINDINLLEVLHQTLTDLSEFIRAQSSNIVIELQQLIRGILHFVFNCTLVLMITAFILVDTGRIRRFVDRLVQPEHHATLSAFLARVDVGLSGVVRGQLIICLVNALLTLAGLLLLKVKFSLILATLAGIFSLVPIFGSIISTIPIALVAFLTSPLAAVLAVGWIALIHLLEANLLNPKIMGSSAQIHPVLIVLALVSGEHFYGIVGALLAVPITSILITLFQYLLVKAHAE
ncbi:MAG: AI-2E family transporter [Myxococcaceae bacterium]|nr:AI-2E family transporter [Myxococcaceae bacterium]MBH2006674.1 AI-2E family transporter [Myxococcaceae bacterium]